jgi:putative SOS response-associated peptidase YedK
MCSNYRPVTSLDRLLTFFGVERSHDQPPPDVDVYPLGLAPFIRLDPDGDPFDTSRPLVAENAMFGLLPDFATELLYGRRTYNARSETIDRLPSFRDAWRAGQRCIIPAECIYEPSYETGRCRWWRIAQPGGVPMSIAGIYQPWHAPDGRTLYTMAMITVNAEQHPVMRRFHRPNDEKRMVVILDPSDYGRWLTVPLAHARQFFRQWHGTLETSPREVETSPASVWREEPPQLF